MNDEVYEPSDDSALLLDIVEAVKGEKALEVGSGSGIISVKLAKLGAEVVSVDINPWASLATKLTGRLNGVDVNVVNCDLSSCFRDQEFDLSVFNPPYLPFQEIRSWIDYAWSGGKSGIEVLVAFLRTVKAKRYYFVYSSLSDFDTLHEELKALRLEIVKSIHRTIGYETIFAVEARPYDQGGPGRA
ncbi:MAG: methyltransferase [Sulfolobaceae archaeon]|nr:methyltransferase [Sulfolobales archaeon]MCG2884499.1 methyltransferase [Sulfolobales archaeon]MCQ4335085.1 methyltransferase [Sulfolobales archaeon]